MKLRLEEIQRFRLVKNKLLFVLVFVDNELITNRFISWVELSFTGSGNIFLRSPHETKQIST